MKALQTALVIVSIFVGSCNTTNKVVLGEYEYASELWDRNIILYPDSTFRLIYRNGMIKDTINGTWHTNRKQIILNSYLNKFNTQGNVIFTNCDTCENIMPVIVKDLFSHESVCAKLTSINNNKIIEQITCDFNGAANLTILPIDSLIFDFLGYESLFVGISKNTKVAIHAYLVKNDVKMNIVYNEKWSVKHNCLISPNGSRLVLKK
jgi:hypothetical protein